MRSPNLFFKGRLSPRLIEADNLIIWKLMFEVRRKLSQSRTVALQGFHELRCWLVQNSRSNNCEDLSVRCHLTSAMRCSEKHDTCSTLKDLGELGVNPRRTKCLIALVIGRNETI